MMSGPSIQPKYRGLPGRLRDDGYDLPDTLTYEEWWGVGELLQQMERSVQWWLGDWWNYGTRRYGEMASQATKDHVKDATGHAYKTVINAATVAKAFEHSRRRENLSWSHHEAVSKLPEEEAEAILDAAEAEALSVFDTRDRVRERKQAIAGTVVGADSAPLPMSVNDLTPEARAAMRLKMGGLPSKHHTAFERGWVAALIWAEDRDSFTRWEL